ncbi:hypothetical protein GBAR_LOCUS27504 [Geodia barretti]|uniref:G-protein coupled receptors family 1 profile domain-containing protein n=1 Tax=Geodia barretti TaxID=519541 RepID=A0AA35TMZ8_GEOBA|nr:hypothetical protein GBAR_LOCUS27504 [Geodia barretti]
MSHSLCPNKTNCSMTEREEGEMNIVVMLRLIMASMSFLGAMSIIASAIYRKTVCSPKVQPIFILSIVDALLSVLWMSGSVVWLKRGANTQNGSSLGCFAINLLTVILQCTAMNMTLIYALLAYSSIKHRSVYMVQQTPVSVHVWHPFRTLLSYLTAWSLPVALVLSPFSVLSVKYGLIQKATDCACWCLPFYGNGLPRLQLGSVNSVGEEDYKLLLHHFISSYSVVLIANFAIVLCSLAAVYIRVFLRIRQIKMMQAQAEGVPLRGANQAMIVAGQKDAQTRVTLFLSIYFLSGIITFAFGVANLATQREQTQHHHHNHQHTARTLEKYYTFLLFEVYCRK